MMKKMLCLLLSLVMILGASATVVANDFPTYEFVVDGFTFEFSHGAIMPEFQVDDNSMLVVKAFNGEQAVDVKKIPNGLPKGLYFYEICEKLGWAKDEWSSPHWNEYVLVDEFVTSVKTYDSGINISVKATAAGKGTQMVEFADQAPILLNDRTMLPIRAVAEFYGWNVSWNGETQEVSIKSGAKEIILRIGRAWINSIDPATQKETFVADLDEAPIIVNGRTMLPVRGVAEALGLNVEWNGAERCVVLS